MKMDFFKMQAQGNDYIYFDFQDKETIDLDFAELSNKLSKRHFSIGADGLVLIESSEKADAKMRIFNADGSEGKMCGSALQCIIHYLSRKVRKSDFKIETASGIKTGWADLESNEVKVDLGIPVLREEVSINDFQGSVVVIGNPHFVTFVKHLEEIQTAEMGSEIESNRYFQDGINVEFVEKVNLNEVKMKVWERGSGVTLSCGSGSCASVYAGIEKGWLGKSVILHSPGGKVLVEYNNQNIFLTGSVEYVYTGQIEV